MVLNTTNQLIVPIWLRDMNLTDISIVDMGVIATKDRFFIFQISVAGAAPSDAV